jgi:hypothetical protein
MSFSIARRFYLSESVVAVCGRCLDKVNERMLLRHQQLKLIGLAAGILFCYSLSAIFQEKVLRQPYGEGDGVKGERFTFAFAFTFVQCIIYASVAKGK